MDTLADVVAAGRDRDGPVFTAAGRSAPYTYGEFSTNAWKAGNLLRHYGVRPDSRLAVVVGPKEPNEDDRAGWLGTAADPLLAILGGATLGATVDLRPAQPVDARAIVLPDGWLDRYEVDPGCSRLAYGGPPEASGVAHFERELWSENPIEPPDPVAPEDAVLRVDDAVYTHEELLGGAETVATDHDLSAGQRVRVDAAIDSAGALAAGIVAPLSVGATIHVGELPDGETPAYTVGTPARDGSAVDPGDVL